MGLLVALVVIVVTIATTICFFGWFVCVLWLITNSPAVGIILLVLSVWMTRKTFQVFSRAWVNMKRNAGIKPKPAMTRNIPTSLD